SFGRRYVIPSLFILRIKLEWSIPSNLAAERRLVEACRARKICCDSNKVSASFKSKLFVAEGASFCLKTAASTWLLSFIWSGRSLDVMESDEVETTRNSMTFFSSRIFPGHG